MSRIYTPEEKAEALVLYASDGLAHAWRTMGIPKPTIASWARRAGFPHTDASAKTAAATEAAEDRAKLLRARLRLGLLEKAVDLLERMDAPHTEFKGKEATTVEYPIAPAAAVQNYATSVGILIDKYRLELGEATDRTETKTLTDGLTPEVKSKLRDMLDRAAKEEVAVP